MLLKNRIIPLGLSEMDAEDIGKDGNMNTHFYFRNKEASPSSTRHRRIGVVLLVLAAALLTVLLTAWVMFGTQLQAALTVQKLDDGLWSMEYRGDYGFDDFLAQGGASSDAEMGNYLAAYLSHGFWKPDTSTAGGKYGCSTLAVKSPDGAPLFGRNFDWQDCDTMLIHTVPQNGYASVSNCCLDFLGFGENWKPDGSIGEKFVSLAAVYVPLDGMNEKGLCVADLMVSHGQAVDQDTEKPDLTTTSAIRLLLDKAATVEEALELLSQYDMHFSIGAAHHLSISDAAGRSVAVEWVNGEMVVTDTPVVTNFYLHQDDGTSGSGQSYVRFDTLTALRQTSDGVMTPEQVRAALAAAAQSNFPGENGGELTCWSWVYDQQEKTALFYDTEDWEHPYTLSLRSTDWLSHTLS